MADSRLRKMLGGHAAGYNSHLYRILRNLTKIMSWPRICSWQACFCQVWCSRLGKSEVASTGSV